MFFEEAVSMFEGYEEFVSVKEVRGEIYIEVQDFLGFDEHWCEIIVEIPDEVYDRVSACELAGAHVLYASAEI